jgi:hypothetical protein
MRRYIDLDISLVLGIFEIHDVSELGSASVIRCECQNDPTQFRPLGGASLDPRQGRVFQAAHVFRYRPVSSAEDENAKRNGINRHSKRCVF